MIKFISFSLIFPIWKNQLWPDRIESSITQTSAMMFLSGHDSKNFYNSPVFFGFYIHDNLVGVNSGHMCVDSSFRSRGLFVYPNYRGRGIGQELLYETISYAKKRKAKFIWSLPKKTSWHTYHKVGFKIASEWFKTDTSYANAYCYKLLNG